MDPETAALPGAFAPTRWTLVLRAQGGSDKARTALSELCAAYYEPVHHFLLRDGWPADEARDLTHSFFARMLHRGDIGAPDPALGRFRAWLLGGVKHYAADVRKSARRLKRGGGVESLSLDVDPGSAAHSLTGDHAPPPDAFFDREWAVAMMNQALTTLESETTAAGNGSEFALLKDWIAGSPAMKQSEAAARAGMTEGAVKVAIHRLRQRFRELLRAAILQTLHDPADCEDELRHLRAALAWRP